MSSSLSSFKRESGISLEMLHWKRASSHAEGRISWFFSSYGRKLGYPLELRPEPQGSSPVLTWNSGFLWSFNRGVRPHLVLRHRTPLSSRGVKGFLSHLHRDLELFLEVPQGCHTSLRVVS